MRIWSEDMATGMGWLYRIDNRWALVTVRGRSIKVCFCLDQMRMDSPGQRAQNTANLGRGELSSLWTMFPVLCLQDMEGKTLGSKWLDL
jgi:hypothetical protein